MDKYEPFLQMIANAKLKQRKAIINTMDKDQLCFICEVALNVLAGNLPISDNIKKQLLPHKSFLRQLANRKISNRFKKKLLNQSTHIFQYLLPLLKNDKGRHLIRRQIQTVIRTGQ